MSSLDRKFKAVLQKIRKGAGDTVSIHLKEQASDQS